MSAARTDLADVEAANTAFYDALEHGDLDAMHELWLGAADTEDAETTEATPYTADTAATVGTTGTAGAGVAGGRGDPTVSVVHPGWPVLTGRGEVMRSYALIMASTDYIQFFLTDVEVSVMGDTALVSCTENILSGGPAEEDGSAGPLVGGLVVATNVFRRTADGAWKLWSHHGSPILVEQDDSDEENGDEGGISDSDTSF